MTSIANKLEPNTHKAVVEGLTVAVAETSVTTMKAQNFHWNVKGMAFGPLHALFQEIYEDHFTGQDELAERVKALGAHAIGRYDAFLKLSKVTESDGDITAQAMVAELKADQETIAGTLHALAEAADAAGDIITNDLAVERATVHEKFAWILGAHLES